MLTLTLDFDAGNDTRRLASFETRGPDWDWLSETLRQMLT
jgi:hypothetical protein